MEYDRVLHIKELVVKLSRRRRHVGSSKSLKNVEKRKSHLNLEGHFYVIFSLGLYIRIVERRELQDVSPSAAGPMVSILIKNHNLHSFFIGSWRGSQASAFWDDSPSQLAAVYWLRKMRAFDKQCHDRPKKSCWRGWPKIYPDQREVLVASSFPRRK